LTLHSRIASSSCALGCLLPISVEYSEMRDTNAPNSAATYLRDILPPDATNTLHSDKLQQLNGS
jgi:hypothetical protein